MADHIQYDFLYDNHFAELKDEELTTERLNLATLADPYVGRYYSADYIRRKILRQTDEEIIEEDKQIEKEIADGRILDPMEIPDEAPLEAAVTHDAMVTPPAPPNKDPEIDDFTKSEIKGGEF